MTQPPGLAGQALNAAGKPGGGQLDALRRHLAARYDRITAKVGEALGEFSGHEEIAHAKAVATVQRQKLIGTPRYAKMTRTLLHTLKGQNLAPAPGVGGMGDTAALAHHVMASEANDRPTFVRNTNPMVLEFTDAKSLAMSQLDGGAQTGGDWLALLVTVDVRALRLATFIDDQQAAEKNEWLRQLPAGQLIKQDADQLRAISDQVVAALGGKVFDLKDKIFREVTFSYDDSLGGGDPDACDKANQAKLDAAKARLRRLVALAVSLKPRYREYGEIIKAVGAHVQKLTDEEGWKVYAATHLKSGKIDYAIDGVDFVLTGLAALTKEFPYPGAGAASGGIQLGVGKITGLLHRLARDARIAEAKKKLGPGGTRSEIGLRKIYLDAMDQDKAMMARRVLQIQQANLEALWSVVGIGLAEIPVPLVGSTIKTFCQGITVGYYKTRVSNLVESLRPVEPGMGEQAEELLVKFVVEPGVDTVKDVVRNQFKEQCAELGRKVWDAAGKHVAALIDFFREGFAHIGDIAKDAAKEGLATFVANLAAALAAELIAKIATDALAPAISGGDLRKILNGMTDIKRDVDVALATV